MSAPREFWIHPYFQDIRIFKKNVNQTILTDSIHVIEHSAYQKKCEEVEMLKLELEARPIYSYRKIKQELALAVEALDVIADVGHPNPVGLARDALSKIKGGEGV